MIKFYEEFDKLFLGIVNFLNGYCKSEVLQDYFLKNLKREIYANLINNFFLNLNEENMKECDLSIDYIEKIKDKYNEIREEVKLELSEDVKNRIIDENYYNSFKDNFREDFPEVQEHLSEFERQIDIHKLNEYITSKEKKLKKLVNLTKISIHI